MPIPCVCSDSQPDCEANGHSAVQLAVSDDDDADALRWWAGPAPNAENDMVEASRQIHWESVGSVQVPAHALSESTPCMPENRDVPVVGEPRWARNLHCSEHPEVLPPCNQSSATHDCSSSGTETERASQGNRPYSGSFFSSRQVCMSDSTWEYGGGPELYTEPLEMSTVSIARSPRQPTHDCAMFDIEIDAEIDSIREAHIIRLRREISQRLRVPIDKVRCAVD